jgi:hypothetical protein
VDTAFGDSDRLATAEQKMHDIKQKNCEFSQYYGALQVLAADLDWNPLVLQNTHWKGLSLEMKDFFYI